MRVAEGAVRTSETSQLLAIKGHVSEERTRSDKYFIPPIGMAHCVLFFVFE